MTFAEYIKEELKYYDENPDEDDTLEAHSNGIVNIEYDYTAHE
tara:strand:+ start:460 stop:588 length:129 start_codon:yes stop_codon:yes gene_type:complete